MKANSNRKYARLAGFDASRAAILPSINQKNADILTEWCQLAYATILQAQNRSADGASNLKGFYDFLGDAARQPVSSNKMVTPAEFVRACMRVRGLITALDAKDCILGRNLFLDGLQIRQIVWFVTGQETRGSHLGNDMRKHLPGLKKYH